MNRRSFIGKSITALLAAPLIKSTALSAFVMERAFEDDFERIVIEAFKVRLDPAEDLKLINDEFGTLLLSGSFSTSNPSRFIE
jgi:hypothetical protein